MLYEPAPTIFRLQYQSSVTYNGPTCIKFKFRWFRLTASPRKKWNCILSFAEHMSPHRVMHSHRLFSTRLLGSSSRDGRLAFIICYWMQALPSSMYGRFGPLTPTSFFVSTTNVNESTVDPKWVLKLGPRTHLWCTSLKWMIRISHNHQQHQENLIKFRKTLCHMSTWHNWHYWGFENRYPSHLREAELRPRYVTQKLCKTL